MFRPRCWKLRQSPGASRAVNTLRHNPTEPEHPASFTHLQIHAQVVHVVPFQGVVLPSMSLDIFQRSSGLTKSLGRPPLSAALCGSVSQVLAFILVVASVRCSTLGKVHPPCIPLPAPETLECFRLFVRICKLLRPLGTELGKSQGYSFRQISCQP
jgi:hypothetical protein